MSFQNDKTILMFNSNTIANSGAFPLNYFGVPVSGALRYPDLINKYASNRIRLKNAIVQNMDLINTNFYAGLVRLTAEVINTQI
jgi:hypothetical protein